MKENYQKILDEMIAGLEEKGEVPKLLLHSCCAPCSSYVLEYLSNYFYITVLYYNPNIYPEDEYYHRAAEQKRFIKEFPTKYPVTYVEGNFEPERFYEIRLREAAEYAKKLNCDYFTTTLSISPMKNAAKLNEIGGRLAEEYGIPYLYSDFKKRDGYKRSTIISAEYGMYRQDYCGCVFSKREREEQKRERAAQESEQTVQE